MQRLGAAHPPADSLQPGLGPNQGCGHQLPLGLQAWVGWLEPGGWPGASYHGGPLEECAAMSLQHTSVITHFARNICMVGKITVSRACSSSQQERSLEGDEWSFILEASDPRSSNRHFRPVPNGKTNWQTRDSFAVTCRPTACWV